MQTAMQLAIEHYENLSAQGSNQAYVIAKFLKEKFLPLEKQQIIDAYDSLHTDCSFTKLKGEQYFAETYGSKGSDEIEKSEMPINLTSFQTEISDENAYTNGHGYNAAIAELPKEISDEEIYNVAKEIYGKDARNISFKEGAFWYREQLKKKQ